MSQSKDCFTLRIELRKTVEQRHTTVNNKWLDIARKKERIIFIVDQCF